MILTRNISLIGSGYLPEFSRVLQYAQNAGYTLPSVQSRSNINRFLAKNKLAGIPLSIFDFIYIFANDGSSAFSRLNFANPNLYYASPQNSPTWESNRGFSLNGVNQYINTTFIPTSNAVNIQPALATYGTYTWDDARVGIQMGANNVSFSNIINLELRRISGSETRTFYAVHNLSGSNAGLWEPGTEPPTAAFALVTRDVNEAQTYGRLRINNYTGSIGQSADSTNPAQMPSVPIYIGALNNNGSILFPTQNRFGLAFGCRGLTAQQEQAFYNNWEEYRLTL